MVDVGVMGEGSGNCTLLDHRVGTLALQTHATADDVAPTCWSTHFRSWSSLSNIG